MSGIYAVRRHCHAVALSMFLCAIQPVWASPIIEMPDTTEVPDLEKSSLLLDMDIPSVRERDPNPMAGPRLNVREFRVQGLVEYPDIGITREEIIKRVEAIRFDMMDEGEVTGSGYTLDELGELSDLLAEIEDETEIEHVGPIEVQRLVFLIREQRRERGITLGMIEMVADTITRYYRERGFVLAKAFIPEQHVRDGVVTLTLLLGELGEVKVHNNDDYSSSLIESMFDGAMDKPITASAIEEHLYFVNDLPGLTAQGFFEAGSQVGDSRLNINVLEEEWWDANLRLDNHGSASSGEYRIYGDLFLHNPLGIGDQLHLGVLNTFQPDNSFYGSVRYNTHVLNPRFRLSLGYSNNDFALDNSESESIAALQIEGRSRVADASAEYQLKRSRAENYAIGMRYSTIESQIRFAAFEETGDIGLDDEVRNVELYYDFDVLDEKSRTLHQGRLGVTSSKFVLGAEDAQEEAPWLLNVDYSMLTFLELPLTSVNARAVLRTSLQYSGVSLSSINQFSLGGPVKARAFTINEFFADDGIHVGADLIFEAGVFGDAEFAGQRLRNMINPFVFADSSYGIAHPTLEGAEETTALLNNVGAGLKLAFGRNLRGNITVATPFSSSQDSATDEVEPGDGTKIYFDIQYSF